MRIVRYHTFSKCIIHSALAPIGKHTSKNANIRRFDPEHPEEPAQVDLNVEVKLPGLTETSPFILLSKPQSLTLPQMLEYVTKERSDTRSRLKAKLHRMVMFIHFQSPKRLTVE